MPILKVRAAAAEIQPLSQNRDHGSFSADFLATLTLFLLVLLSPSVSRDVRHTPSVPALTSRAGAFLPFVFLTPPAAPCVVPSSQAPCFSLVRLCSGAPVFSLVTLALLSSRFHSSSSVRLGAPVFSLDTGVPMLTVSVRSPAGAGLRVKPTPQHKGLLLPGA